MHPFLDTSQIEELSNFDVIEALKEDPSFRWNDIDFDDESNDFETLLSSPNDFWKCLTFSLSAILSVGMKMVYQFH